MPTTDEATLEVKGLSQFRSALRQVNDELTREMTVRLRHIAEGVRGKALEIATAEGFAPPGRSGRGRGKLVRNLKISVRGGTASIRETASRGGFLYPAVYEYGHSQKWGHRPFLHPAVQAEETFIQEEFERLLDEVLAGFK